MDRPSFPAHEQQPRDHALRIAILDTSTERVHDALARGANPNITDQDNDEPLTVSVLRSNPPLHGWANTVLTLMLLAGADPNAQDHQGDSLVMVAIDHENHAAMQQLLAAGADLWPHASDGRNALYLLAKAGWADDLARQMARLPTHRDRPVNPLGWTPLHVAAYHGHVQACQALLAGGARRRLLDRDGHTARALALAQQHWPVLALFDQALLRGVAERAMDHGTAGHRRERPRL